MRVLPLSKVVVLDNPYIGHLLTKLRDRSTDRQFFRSLMEEIAVFMAYEAVRELSIRSVDIETPLDVAKGIEVEDDKVVVIAILRAGIPMLNGALRVLKRARVGFITAKRIEEEGKTSIFNVEVNYVNIPEIERDDVVIVVDPMLATASTMCRVAKIISAYRPSKMVILSVIAAKQGVDNLTRCTEGIDIPIHLYVASIDPQLNDKGFIVPGLGDAGDRAFTL